MAHEIRKIEFDMVETQAALQVFSAKTGQNIPNHEIVSVKPDGVGSGRLYVQFIEGAGKMELRDKDLSAALLVFCREKNILVPKGGKKVVKADGNKVTMLIKLD